MLNHPYIVAAFEGAGAMVGIVLGTKHAIKELLQCAIGSSAKQLNDATPVKSQRDSEWAYVKVVQLRAFSPSKSSTKAPATPEPSTPRPPFRARICISQHARRFDAASLLCRCAVITMLTQGTACAACAGASDIVAVMSHPIVVSSSGTLSDAEE
jgi:hypothetical protein